MNAEAIRAVAQIEHLVRESDSAAAWGNELPVLATPVLLWLAEIACMRATENALDDGEMTVGAGHACEHRAPTPVGEVVWMTARLRSVDGRCLEFDVSAVDRHGEVFTGRHTRAVLDRSRFTARVCALAGKGSGP